MAKKQTTVQLVQQASRVAAVARHPVRVSRGRSPRVLINIHVLAALLARIRTNKVLHRALTAHQARSVRRVRARLCHAQEGPIRPCITSSIWTTAPFAPRAPSAQLVPPPALPVYQGISPIRFANQNVCHALLGSSKRHVEEQHAAFVHAGTFAPKVRRPLCPAQGGRPRTLRESQQDCGVSQWASTNGHHLAALCQSPAWA